MRVVWSSKARSDLVRLHEFLRPVAPLAAKRVFQDLSRAPRRLLEHPRLGERVDKPGSREIRRLTVGNYELQYEVAGDTLYIVRIWHGREQR